MGNSLVCKLAFLPPKRERVQWQDASKIHFVETLHKIRIPLLFVPNANSAKLVIYCHGNASDLMAMEPFAHFFSQNFSVNFLAVEYAGYAATSKNGETELLPSEAYTYGCVDAAWKFAIEKKFDPKKIILFGKSIGSGPITDLAMRLSKEKKQVGAVILQSPIASAVRVVFYSHFTLWFDIFDNWSKVSRIISPLLIINGTADEVVPSWHSEYLYEAADETARLPPVFLEGAGHNNIEVDFHAQWVAAVKSVLRNV